ncbi:S-layer homology domain-containing protein [Sporobacter termitidis DSM 10068]|uniref:S-layer homology domain-containing protein n=1 Tax=Sporobacter termitidis DSM 10068 TaxID=1123282 RepID=A0A1M5WW02_9FIRM|nr:trypsin-like peptidase domain-containing protein [Sporobacter termitidis]SHH91681.1 S-layer homology domain-containing protein [Sporobacter termitidis DSM 10068]
MKKRAVSLLCAVLLAVFVLPITSLAAGSLSNFTKVNTYQSGKFSDVSDQWFAANVQAAYEYDLMSGTSTTAPTFSPDNNLTIAEAVKLAACLHSIYSTGAASFAAGTPWYQPYADYALQNNIISAPYANYTAVATRSDFAVILASALPDEALTVKNDIADNAIPDVLVSYSYGPAVYKLYRAGILTGDTSGNFNPSNKIQRSEVATIVTRMASPDLRKSVSLSSKELTATEISAKCAPAVFYINVYDAAGKKLGNASGFFISSSGLAVTNYHVIKGAASAKVTTKDGKTYDVSGVYDYNKTNDLALLQVNGTGFPYLSLGNSDTALTGATIYAIGYPLGIDQTFTKGSITNASHPDNGVNYIMIDASMSPGSSGGALVNAYGQVIGITSGGYTSGQNLNVAVPVNLLQALKQTNTVSLAAIAASNPALSITASSSSVTVAKGAQTTVTLTASSDDFDSIAYLTGNKSVVSCTWGNQSGNSFPLTLTGLSAGSTTVQVLLLDPDDNTLASTTINVTVTGSGSGTSSTTSYYSGYSPTPDFGAYAGAPLFTSYYDASIGGTGYYYALSSIPMDPSVYVPGYSALLQNNGFDYLGSFVDDSGNTVLTYQNDSANLEVMTGLSSYNGVNFFLVLVVSA